VTYASHFGRNADGTDCISSEEIADLVEKI